MNSKSLDLIPYGIELFEVIFQDFVLRAFDPKFISRNCDFIDLKIFFFSDKDLKH